MNFLVCAILTTALRGIAIADIPWSHSSHSPISFGGSRYSFPSYEAYRNHNKAKYYARKAHDLAKLRSSIYGVGHGLYGFRYGSFFPKYFSKPLLPLLPFVTKYPIFDLGLHVPSPSQHFFFSHPPPPFHGISGHITGFGYPATYQNSHHHSYSYEKGYSYAKGHSHGHKHSSGYHTPPIYGHPSINIPPWFKKKLPEESVIYKYKNEPGSHGYEYAYVKESPGYHKHIPSQDLGGYHTVQGIQYSEDGHGHEHKIPELKIAYDSQVHLQPELILADEIHDDAYIPNPKKFRDITPDVDGHLLRLHGGHNKFDGSDFLEYKSELSH